MLLVQCCLFLVVSSSIAIAQDREAAQAPSENIRMYALLEPTPMPSNMPGARLAERFPQLGGQHIATPRMLWFHWANGEKRPIAAFLFLLFFSVTLSTLFPKWTAKAQVECKTHFWRSLLFGVLVVAVAVVAMRLSLATLLGWPLAILVMGGLQFLALTGLTAMIVLMGQSIGFYLKFETLIKRPDVRRLAYIVIGALICALLLQIPGVGTLPRIGTRLVALLAMVGIGALFRARRLNSETA
jgi:hypothetical protein